MLKRTKLAVLAMFTGSMCSVGWAMQALDDDSMAQATGQDGVTLSVGTLGGSGVIGFDRISLQDGNGFVGNTSPASIGYFAATLGSGGVGFYSGAGAGGGTTPIATPLTIRVDADGNSTNPVLNTSITFDSNLTRINIKPFAIRLTADAANHALFPSNHNIVANSQRDIVKVGGTGIDIIFNTGSALGINMQLSHQPQGHMFVFTGGRIKQIKNDTNSPIEVVSYTGNTASSSLKFNFDLQANAVASPTGIQLAGMYVDLTAGVGLTLGKTGNLDKFDVGINNVVMGSTAATPNANTFNNLKNGSLGNFGAIGTQITNLSVNVKGM
jgi:hypothetical protein